MFEHNPVD